MSALQASKVATFDQVSAMKSRAQWNKAATQGACHCFSIHWCSLLVRSPGGGAKDRMREIGVGDGRRSAILQKVFGDRWGTDGMEGADELVLKDNLVKSETMVPYSAYAINAVEYALSRSGGKGAAFLYSFWFDGNVRGAEGGAHSIAFYCTIMGQEMAVHIFDPNFGEFVCRIGEFQGMLMELFRCYGPLNSHNLRRIHPL